MSVSQVTFDKRERDPRPIDLPLLFNPSRHHVFTNLFSSPRRIFFTRKTPETKNRHLQISFVFLSKLKTSTFFRKIVEESYVVKKHFVHKNIVYKYLFQVF